MRHPTTPSAVMLLATGALALAAGGCGIKDPLNDPTALPAARHTNGSPNEIGGPSSAPPRSALADAAASPTAAITRFAGLYVNWTTHTLAAQQRQLAAISIGEASSSEAAAAAHTPADYELRRSHLANTGRVVAITRTIPPRPGSYMVITRERTTGTGLYDQLPAAYHLTIATVQRIPGGWAVSQWHPQS